MPASSSLRSASVSLAEFIAMPLKSGVLGTSSPRAGGSIGSCGVCSSGCSADRSEASAGCSGAAPSPVGWSFFGSKSSKLLSVSAMSHLSGRG
ncbi:MAG: hypothetical protein KGY81_06270 [Phycisphaerae bacterium]|nr:hypothetical protein [Phycisphaerae bacterium]